MKEVKTKFKIGQIVRHKLFDYTGVIFDIDPSFEGTDEWYDKVAETKPPRDKPWCHVLVSDDEKTTYVAEKNIEEVLNPKPINHSMVQYIFEKFNGYWFGFSFRYNVICNIQRFNEIGICFKKSLK